MADSFHFSVNIISRGKGKSAVASAAYISGDKIKNEWDGVTYDYTINATIRMHTFGNLKMYKIDSSVIMILR